MISIRPYDKKDFRFVQDVCVACHAEETNATIRALTCALYCDYYLDNEPQFCFVAVDENDVPVGYIVANGDVDLFNEQMDDNYLPLVRKLDSGEFFHYSAQRKLEQRYVKQGYTARVRVFVSDCEEQGVADKLVDALSDKLTESFVEGMYVLTGIKDADERAFYEKHGFEDIDYISGAVVYGKKLFSED